MKRKFLKNERVMPKIRQMKPEEKPRLPRPARIHPLLLNLPIEVLILVIETRALLRVLAMRIIEDPKTTKEQKESMKKILKEEWMR